nr:MAG TPA: hypothetical protein [Caudoviricetes sp.]
MTASALVFTVYPLPTKKFLTHTSVFFSLSL